MRDQPDLREQPERHAGGQRQELEVTPQQRLPAAGARAGDVTEVGGMPGASPSGVSPICSRRARELPGGEDRHVEMMTTPIDRRRRRKAQQPIGATQSGEKINAADARRRCRPWPARRAACARTTARRSALTGGGAHRAPAGAAEHRRGEQLPGRGRVAQPRTPTASESAPALVTAGNAETAVQCRQIGDHDARRPENGR